MWKSNYSLSKAITSEVEYSIFPLVFTALIHTLSLDLLRKCINSLTF